MSKAISMDSRRKGVLEVSGVTKQARIRWAKLLRLRNLLKRGGDNFTWTGFVRKYKRAGRKRRK